MHHRRRPLRHRPVQRAQRDPRVVCLNLGLLFFSLLQVFWGTAPTAINSRAFSGEANAFFLWFTAGSAMFVLVAALVDSEYWEVGLELCGSIGLTVALSLFVYGGSEINDRWMATLGVGWALSLAVGNGIRVLQLVWRLL